MDSQVLYAARKGSIIEIEKLCEKNREVLREVTFEKNNVLHIAARRGHSTFVEWIRDHVVEEDYSSMCVACNSYLNTPLHEAAQAGKADMVRNFIPFFENVAGGSDEETHLVNSFGETPLLIACKYGHVEAASILLEKSTPTNLRYPKYQPCLHLAASGGHLDIVRLLLNINNMERFREVWTMPDAHGATPLHAALYGKNIEIVKEILNPELGSGWRNWLMKTADSHGICAIHGAVILGKSDIIDYLMESVPDCIEIRSRDHKTVLHFAVAYDRFDLVKKLIPVDRWMVNDCDDSGDTVLHLAAHNSVDPQLLQYLLSLPGLNVNALNNQGLTPLDKASEQILEGSNAKALNNKGLNQLDIASSHKQILEKADALASNRTQFNQKVIKSRSMEMIEDKTKEKKGEDHIKDTDTLVASLVATVTFAAIFQVPGGIENENKDSVHYGVAKLGFQRSFIVFLVCDTAALFTSLVVIIAWILRERLPRKIGENKSRLKSVSAACLGVSILCTAITFTSALYLVIIPPNLGDLKSTHRKAFDEYQILFWIVACVALGLWFLGFTFFILYYLTHRKDISRKDWPTGLICIFYVIPLIFEIFLLFEMSQMKNLRSNVFHTR